MSKFEALIEINPEKVESLAEYVAYCKYYFKPKSKEKIENYLFKSKKGWYLNRDNKNVFLEEFKFLEREINNCVEAGNGRNRCENQLAKKLKDYKSNETLKDFPLNWLKNEIIGKETKYIDFNGDNNIQKNIQKIEQISGIYDNPTNLQNYIDKLPKHSFAIWFKFQLKAPYFSKDDDEFYIIQNPILKETNFKVPMISGSAWKGALAHAFRDLISESGLEDRKKKTESFLRIFGAGSESIKAIEKYVLEKGSSLEKAKEKLIEFLLFELGLEIDGKLLEEINNIRSKDDLLNVIKNGLSKNELSKKLEDNQKDLPLEFQTHKGRAIFYPTYFDGLSLEIINPHDRRKRAGKNPIHYEVVPARTEGIFQLIYIPFDGITKDDETLKKEVEEDLKNLCSAIEKLSNKGIGAKTKLGWGRFEILKEDKKICLNSDLGILEGWKRCQD